MRASHLRIPAALALGAAVFLTQFAGNCNGGGGGGGMCMPMGAPIMHGTNVDGASEEWQSGIHIVTTTIHVKNGATLTIDPCSEVQLAAGASIVVDGTATGLVANGSMGSPITFHRADAASAWGSLQVSLPATMQLAFATLDGGGTGPSGDYNGASLVARGDWHAMQIPAAVSADHVTITGSAGLGVFLQSARFTDSSTQLTVTGSGSFPVYGGIASVTSLPRGSYTGNAIDKILLQSIGAAAYEDSFPLEMNATLHDYGVPYRVGNSPSSIIVGSGVEGHPSALLTIEPNVTLLFTPQGSGGRSQLLVRGVMSAGTPTPQGALIVEGTPATSVTFDSAADVPAPGDWQGLYFATEVDPRTLVSGAQILNAGGNSGFVGVCESAPGSGHGDGTCAVVISVADAPSAFLQGSAIVNSGNCGVYRGWMTDEVDFTGANMFVHVPGCVQTNIPNYLNLCSTMPCDTSP